MNIVCDTNVLISAIVFGGNAGQIIKYTSEGMIINYISPAIIKEFEDVLKRPKFAFSHNEISAIIQLFYETFEYIITSQLVVEIKDDPDDNRILETALAADADFIISGDKHLLQLGKWGNIPILNPSKFLKILE